MLSYKTEVRVRYADTDKAGVVYYANYPVFYEVGRTEMLRSLGCEYSRLEKEGILCPVVELVSHYRKSAVYDDLLTVEVAVRERPSAKIIFEYKIYNEKGELLNDGSTTLVFIDTNSGRLTRAPKVILDVFDKSENA